eukprot:6192010-Pleurochrysis_carterae.AAC.8
MSVRSQGVSKSHLVRLRRATQRGPKYVGAEAATMLKRASSMIARTARSVTPFSSWTCGGQVEECTALRERNCVPTSRLGSYLRSLRTSTQGTCARIPVPPIGAHGIGGLESRVVVHEHEHILETVKAGAYEGSRDIGLLGEFASAHAGQPSRRPADREAGASAVSFGSWEAQPGRANVQSTVQAYGRVTRRHHVDVMLRA